MGMGLTVYSVDLAAMREVFGSKDKDLLNELEAAFEDELGDDEGSVDADSEDEGKGEAEDKEEDEDEDEEWSGEDSITLREALQNIVFGNVDASDESASQYFRIVVLLCGHFGSQIEAQAFKRLPGVKIRRALDAVLESKQIAEHVRCAGVICESVMNPLGFSLGDEGIGFLESDDIELCLEQLEPLDISGMEPDVGVALQSVYTWLTKAKSDDQGLAFVVGK